MADAAGLENRCDSAPNHNSPNNLTHTPDSALADCLALLRPVRPDLARVVERWDALPEAVRSRLLALVESNE